MVSEVTRERIKKIRAKRKEKRKLQDRFEGGKNDPSKTADLQKDLYQLITTRVKELAGVAGDVILETRYTYKTLDQVPAPLRDAALISFGNWLSDGLIDIEREGFTAPINTAYLRGSAEAKALQGLSISPIDFGQQGRTLGQVVSRLFNDMEGLNAAAKNKLREIITQGVINGDSPIDVGKYIKEAIDDLADYRAERIARTEIVYAKNNGYLDDLEDQDAKTLVRWLSTQDSKTRSTHAVRDGIILDIKQARQLLGEPNCRCSIAAITKDDKRAKEKIKDSEIKDYLR